MFTIVVTSPNSASFSIREANTTAQVWNIVKDVVFIPVMCADGIILKCRVFDFDKNKLIFSTETAEPRFDAQGKPRFNTKKDFDNALKHFGTPISEEDRKLYDDCCKRREREKVYHWRNRGTMRNVKIEDTRS